MCIKSAVQSYMYGVINADVCFSRNGLRHTMLFALYNIAHVSVTTHNPTHKLHSKRCIGVRIFPKLVNGMKPVLVDLHQ